MLSSLHITVTEPGQAGEARRAAAAWASRGGLGEEFGGRVALVVTELAKNLALHTTNGGSIVVRRLAAEGGVGASVLSLDRGPGLDNFSPCLRDGYSTAGTAGIGLGGVQRMSRLLEAHSQRGIGTALFAELWDHPPRPGEDGGAPRAGGVSVPIRGETECGDAWAEQHGAGWSRYLVADGLGHGPLAAAAAQAARKVFEGGGKRSLPELIRAMHERMRETRGAAAAVAHLDLAARQVAFAGIGNITAAVVTPEKTSHLVSHSGTVGVVLPTNPREFTYPLPTGGLLVMHSDGLKTQWQLSRYAGLAARHPELVAGVLYRDFSRGTDDTTVVVVRPRA